MSTQNSSAGASPVTNPAGRGTPAPCLPVAASIPGHGRGISGLRGWLFRRPALLLAGGPARVAAAAALAPAAGAGLAAPARAAPLTAGHADGALTAGRHDGALPCLE